MIFETFEEILNSPGIIGKQLQGIDVGIVFQGPISDIRRENEMVIIEFEWIAWLVNADKKIWGMTKGHEPISFRADLVRIEESYDTRVSVIAPYVSEMVIFLDDSNNLDPDKILPATP